MKQKIWISPYIQDYALEAPILSGYDLISNSTHDLEGCVGLIIWHEKFPDDFINYKSIKAISRFGAGIDNLNLDFIDTHGLRICNVPDYGVDEVSDTALAFIMWCSRGLGTYNYISQTVNDGTWESNILPAIKRSSSQVIGIVGAGRIGSSLALKAKAVGFKVKIFDPFSTTGHEKILGVKREDNLKALLSSSDIVSLNCDLNVETRHIVDNEFISSMQSTAYLVNTARGELFADFTQLLSHVKSGRIAGLATDVLPQEPPSAAVQTMIREDSRLRQRVLLSPHTAFYSTQAFDEMRIKSASNLACMLGEELLSKPELELKDFIRKRTQRA